MSSLSYDDLELGPSTITYKVPPGCDVPKKGELIPTRSGTVIVIDSSSSKGYLKVMLLNDKPLSDRFAEHRIEVEAAMEEIAEMLYNETSTGLISKVGWILLPDALKAKYYKLAHDVITHLDVKNLLILPYD